MLSIRPSRKALVVFGAVFVLYAWFVHFWPTFQAANESIRIYYVQAMVDDGSASIDPVMKRYNVKNTDRAEYKGRSYLDKAPGLSWAVVPVYWVLTRVLGMSTEIDALPALSHLLLLFGVAFPAVLGAWCTYRIVLESTGSERGAWVGALTLALATPYTVYATLFFGHATAAALGIASFYLTRRERPAAAGALAGAMVLVDTSTAALALVLGIYAGLRRRRLGDLLRFGFAGAPFVLAQLVYNKVLFDGFFEFAYQHKAASRFAAIHGQGLFGFDWPRPEALWGLSFGTKRGLFFHAPVLLVGAVLLWRRPATDALGRRDLKAVAAVVATYFLWIAGFVDWEAGDAYGPRHLVPLVPFAAVLVGLAASLDREWRWLRWGVSGLVAFSACCAWVPIATFPYAPAIFGSPVAQLGFPLAVQGHVSPSLASGVGLAGWLGALAALVWLVPILRQLRPDWRTVACGLACAAIIGGGAWALRPAPTRTSVRLRCVVEVLLGHPEGAREHCEQFDGIWGAGGGSRCVLPPDELPE